MHRSLALSATACLLITGCAKHQAAIVDGDPFNPLHELQSQVATVSSGQIPAADNQDAVIGAKGVPDGTQVRQTMFVDRDGQKLVSADVEDQATATPDKSEWWKSEAVADATPKEGIKIPPSGSVQGRVGYASASYGMGRIGKP